MSDSGDDWEKQLEDEEQLDKNITKTDDDKKKAAFKDEDAYDSDEERKKQEAERKAAAATAQAQGGEKKKAKGGQKDFDKMFEDRLKANKPAGATAMQQRIEEIKKSGLSAEA